MTKSYPNLADPDEAPLRQPPFNIPVEQALLGAVLANNQVLSLERVSALSPEHFFEPAHGRIFAAAKRLVERGQLATTVTLSHFFERDEALTEVGGAQYLARLLSSLVSVIDAPSYAQTITSLWARRCIIDKLTEELANAYDPSVEDEAEQIAERIEGSMRAIIDGIEGETSHAVNITDAMDLVIQQAERVGKGEAVPGIPTGLADVDQHIASMRPGQLIVIAGRTSMGKTTLAECIADNVAARLASEGDTGCVFFASLEMSKEELSARALARRTGIASSTLDQGNQQALMAAIRARSGLVLPIDIDDRPGRTVAQIRSAALRRHRKRPVKLLVVDHLGKVKSPPGNRRNDNRVVELGDISGGLKDLGKELGCPVIVLCQLSRRVEKERDIEDRRPTLADLRESGQIEENSDICLLLYRAEYYWQRELDAATEAKRAEITAKLLECQNTAEIAVAKNRNGAAGHIAKVRAKMAIHLFSNLARRGMS